MTTGTIVKLTLTTSGGSTTHDGTYLVTWNGHGDALTLEKIETSGALTVANRFSYTTWGSPSVTTHNGHPDHRFRYRYVGRFGVVDDGTTLVATGLLYMHARHCSPELGRFLQPDPSRLETNHYGYGENSPVTKVDPEGEAAVAIPIAICLALPWCQAALAAGAVWATGFTVYIGTQVRWPTINVCLWDCNPNASARPPARPIGPASDPRLIDWVRFLNRHKNPHLVGQRPPFRMPGWCRQNRRNLAVCRAAAIGLGFAVTGSYVWPPDKRRR